MAPVRTHNHIVTAEQASTRSAGRLAPHTEAFRWLKEQSGLSEYRFGLEIGIDERTVQRWLSGERCPLPHMLERNPDLARAYAQKWAELLEGYRPAERSRPGCPPGLMIR